MDVHDPKTRSYNMSQIHPKDTKPELIVRRHLFSRGFRYRKNVTQLPGKPDIVLPKYKTCIFVNGCFWHKHENCKYFVWPKDNIEFWMKKINANVIRDLHNYEALRQQGWRVLILWECELKKKSREETLEGLVKELRGSN